jgi:hypothetical protein
MGGSASPLTEKLSNRKIKVFSRQTNKKLTMFF